MFKNKRGQILKKKQRPGQTIIIEGWAKIFIIVFMLMFVAQLMMLIILNWKTK